jgi:hypothetical protein
MIFIIMKDLIKKVLREETSKELKDILEIRIQQDTSKTKSIQIDQTEISLILEKVILSVKRCTRIKNGRIYYQVKSKSLEDSDLILHRILIVGDSLELTYKCIEEKVNRYSLNNQDESEVNLVKDVDKDYFLQTLYSFANKFKQFKNPQEFSFLHDDLIELMSKPVIVYNY